MPVREKQKRVKPRSKRSLNMPLMLLALSCGVSIVLVFLTLLTLHHLRPAAGTMQTALADSQHVQVRDRFGFPLAVRGTSVWNTHDHIALHDIPPLLLQAFVLAEDKRFYQHAGDDWLARIKALYQNLRAFRSIRGASTLTEQVVRILHPRPRTLWSRWLEGWEAGRLEAATSKAGILEFYVNQVPYAANQRGIVQAARYYFDRDLDTLTIKEQLALVVLVRAPSRLDLYANPQRIVPAINRLADRLLEQRRISAEHLSAIKSESFQLERPRTPIPAWHFVNQAVQQAPHTSASGTIRMTRMIRTTLDAGLQRVVQGLLDQRLQLLKNQHVQNGAVLVVEHATGEVLAWVVAGNRNLDLPAGFLDTVLTPRQPGSALKPFLYALALEEGWSAATIIPDTPLTESVGLGLHQYQNYSRLFYGPVTLREALGNSLNIPALRTIQFVGSAHYLFRLHALRLTTLNQHPDFYGDGLALGNGEVSLFALVQAYAALANQGAFLPITLLMDDPAPREKVRVFSPEVSSLIGNILSDPDAKRLEFGAGGILDFPVQTAVKTGTSSDYRDAWAVGFNYRYTVGVWMGNLSQQPTKNVSGARGPALVLRSVFAELNKHQHTRPLYLSPRLVPHPLCRESGALQREDETCSRYTEWFLPGTEPGTVLRLIPPEPLRWRQPTNGLQLAADPRIPDDLEVFPFEIQGVAADAQVEWTLDGATLAQTTGGSYAWPVQPGTHRLHARIHTGETMVEVPEIEFVVK